MSSTRRNAAPRKRPAQVSEAVLATLGDQATSEVSDKTEADDSDFDLDEAKREILRDFEIALGDAEGTTVLAESFEAALQALSEEDARKPVTAADLKATVRQAFQAEASTDDLERAQQERLLNDALHSLECKDTQIVLEFSRRLQQDGQDSALQWIQEQILTASAKDGQEGDVSEPKTVSATKSETVRSRSRRLRGPPGRG